MPANSTYSFSAGQILTAVDLNGVFAQTVAFAADSSNANTGTLPVARLPYTMDQNVATTSNVQFRDAVFTGNLTVSGTTTFVNTNVLEIKDANIQIAYGAANSFQANGGGFNIGGANVNFYYDDTSNNMVLDRILSIGNSSVNTIFGYSSTALAGGQFLGNVNNYFQVYIYNSNSGINATSDLALYNDAGTSSNNFIDIGIDSSAYSNATWTITGPNEGYLYTGASNLAIGVVGRSAIKFFSNGQMASDEAMRIDAGSNVNIGNTKSGATSLTVGNGTVNTVITSTAVQIANNVANTSGSYPASNTVGTALGSTTKRWAISANTIDASGLISGSSGANITGTANASVSIYVGANVYMNTTNFFVGNSTVNTNIQAGTLSVNGAVVANNSGVYASGVVNGATIQASATFTANSTLVNAAAVNITGQVNTATLYAATSANIGSYFTVNSTAASKTVNSSFSGANLYVNTTNTAFASNTTLAGTNTSITSNLNVTGSISGVTANLSTSVNSALITVGANFIANTSGMYHTATANANSFTTTGVTVNTSAVAAGANVYINATSNFVGNSTVNTNITAGQISLSGQTVNSSVFTGLSYTANNSSYLGGLTASGYQTTAGLSGNVATLTANAAGYLNGKTESNLNVNNSSTSNTANNSAYLGGTAAANYLTNTGAFTISGVYTHAANVVFSNGNVIIANGSFGTNAQVLISNGTSMYWGAFSANNTLNLVGSNGYNFVQNTDSRTLSGNLYFTGANLAFSSNSGIWANGSFGNTGQALTTNGSAIYWSTIVGTNTAAQYTWSNTQTFQNTITFSTSILANTINATSMTLGNTTVNTYVTANQITLNGSNVVTQATALKVYYANGTQAFP